MPVDARAFRDTLGLFATGVAVVATQGRDDVHAMTVNAVSSLSLDPMLVLFCPSKKARMGQRPETIERFTINFLRYEQQALSTYFAGSWNEPVPPPFRFVHWAGGPRLQGCIASIACETERIVDGGDHWLVIGRVLELHRGLPPHRPLVFFKGQYRAIDFSESRPAPDLTEIHDEPAHIFYDH